MSDKSRVKCMGLIITKIIICGFFIPWEIHDRMRKKISEGEEN